MRTSNSSGLLNFFKGPGSILLSAFLFYMATFMVRIGFDAAEMPTIVFLSSRFLLGYVLLLVWFRLKRSKASNLKAVNKKWLWYRAVWNLIAVFFFYLGVIYGTVTGANILNMTYPAFVALFSIWLLTVRLTKTDLAGICLTLVGVFFISFNGEYYYPEKGDLFGLLSAITAGVAIVALKIIRETDSTDAILFYTFRLGAWLTIIPVIIIFWQTPSYLRWDVLYYSVASAIFGILGQIFLTFGYRFVNAVEGSIYSASRLLFALFMGMLFWQKDIYLQSILGAILILLANLVFAFKKTAPKSSGGRIPKYEQAE